MLNGRAYTCAFLGRENAESLTLEHPRYERPHSPLAPRSIQKRTLGYPRYGISYLPLARIFLATSQAFFYLRSKVAITPNYSLWDTLATKGLTHT